MKEKFLKNLSFFVALNLLVKTIYVFGVDRVVQNTVGTEAYGKYYILFNFVIILQIFLDLGLENFSRKEIASSPGLIKKYLSSILNLKILLGLFYFIVCTLWALIRGFNSYELKLLSILMFNQFLASFILYLRANLGGLQKFKLEGLISVLDKFVMIFICGTLLINPVTRSFFKIEWFILAQTFAFLVSLIFTLIMVLREVNGLKLNFNILPYFSILRKLLPYATLVLLMAIYMRVDSVLLGELLTDGETQAGIYAHSFRLLDYLSNYALLFPMILIPSFSKMIKDKQSVNSVLRIAVLALVIPLVIFLISCIPYRYQIFDLLYDEHIRMSADIFVVLIISFVGVCISYTFGALLTAGGKLRQLNLMAIAAVTISIALNFILIPRYKALGAAYANATAQTFTVFYQIIICTIIYKLPINYRVILKSVLLLGLLFVIIYVSRDIPIYWYVKIILTSIVGLLMVFLLKLVNLKSLLTLLNSKGDELE